MLPPACEPGPLREPVSAVQPQEDCAVCAAMRDRGDQACSCCCCSGACLWQQQDPQAGPPVVHYSMVGPFDRSTDITSDLQRLNFKPVSCNTVPPPDPKAAECGGDGPKCDAVTVVQHCLCGDHRGVDDMDKHKDDATGLVVASGGRFPCLHVALEGMDSSQSYFISLEFVETAKRGKATSPAAPENYYLPVPNKLLGCQWMWGLRWYNLKNIVNSALAESGQPALKDGTEYVPRVRVVALQADVEQLHSLPAACFTLWDSAFVSIALRGEAGSSDDAPARPFLLFRSLDARRPTPAMDQERKELPPVPVHHDDDGLLPTTRDERIKQLLLLPAELRPMVVTDDELLTLAEGLEESLGSRQEAANVEEDTAASQAVQLCTECTAEPAYVQHSAVSQQPTYVQHSAVIHQPTYEQQPAVIQQLALVQQPAAVQQPALVQRPAVVQQPAMLQQPVIMQQPGQQPAVIQQPALVQQPAFMQQSAFVRQPPFAQQPTFMHQAAFVQQPAFMQNLCEPRGAPQRLPAFRQTYRQQYRRVPQQEFAPQQAAPQHFPGPLVPEWRPPNRWLVLPYEAATAAAAHVLQDSWSPGPFLPPLPSVLPHRFE